MRKIKRRSDCPISFTLDFFGDKWTFLILRDIVFGKKRFYKEFLDAGEGIATNVLSDRLKMLEQNGILKSEKYEKIKTKKVYKLTEKGKDLIPMLLEMILWGAKYDDKTIAPKEFIEELENDKTGLIEKLLSNLD